MPTKTEWVVAFVLPLQLTLLARYFLTTTTTTAEESDKVTPSYFKLWCFYFLIDATYGHLFHTILLVPARWIARHLPGAVVPSSDTELVKQEESSNDTSLNWPSADVIAKLPSGWVVKTRIPIKKGKIITTCDGNEGINTSAKKKKSKSKNNKPNNNSQQCNNNTAQSDQKSTDATKPDTHQPYYLNHVRGSTRIRQASQRIGAAIGSLLASYMICQLSGSIKLQDVGLTLPILRDLAWGFLIGLSIVTIIFLMEIWFGWIKVGGFFQTVVPNESFAINFLWDVLFHVGVSINEEVLLRGWMFTLGCRGILVMALDWFEKSSTAATFSIIASIVLQSSLFSFLHLHSPGSTYVSLINLFLGGIAASINVLVAGGSLWLGIGWHFGWNIFMGHVLGRSTSGIPLSCACIEVIPRPNSETLHGGTFGPEQGVLAPLAYILGMSLVVCVYGFDSLNEWRDELVSSCSV